MTINTPIYLDYAATTPVDKQVAEKMWQFLTIDGQFGNPASRSHRYGWQAEEAVDIARNQVADCIGADPREIVFTSGATEADNLALKGIIEVSQVQQPEIITCMTEHKAILDSCKKLESDGVKVTYLQPNGEGLLTLEQIAEAVTANTVLVSVMAVNNETGVIQDIAKIGAFCRSKNIAFHVDAAQAAGKIPFDVNELNIDMASFSAHKVYGPKGIGALFVKRSTDNQPAALIHGGGHERGMRSGTLPTHQIVGMGEAFELAAKQLPEEMTRLKALKEKLWDHLSELGGIHRNGSAEHCAPGILNITVDGVDGETLLMSLYNLAVSSGSACNSASVEPSYVLRAMGISHQAALNALRLSVGRYTTIEEIDYACEELTKVITQLRSMNA